jgi:hypothetical protein
MRGPFVWILVLVGIGVVILAGVAIGSRDDSGEQVTAGEWAQHVCGAVGVWRGEIEAIVEDVRTPNASSTAGGEEPQSETPQGRTGFVRKGLERAVQATETLVEGIDRAGVPDAEQGEEAAEQVADWAGSALDDLEEAQDSLDEEAETLEEAVGQLTDAARSIGAALAGGVQAVGDAARADPALAAALRESSTCQELLEEAGEG